MSGTRGSLVSAIPLEKLLESNQMKVERPDLEPEAVKFRKAAQRAFFETVKANIDSEAVVNVSKVATVAHTITGTFKDHAFKVDVPTLISVNLWNNQGWEPHLALVWQDSTHNSLLGTMLAPVSYKLVMSTITVLVEQYPWMVSCLPESRWYGNENPW